MVVAHLCLAFWKIRLLEVLVLRLVFMVWMKSLAVNMCLDLLARSATSQWRTFPFLS